MSKFGHYFHVYIQFQKNLFPINRNVVNHVVITECLGMSVCTEKFLNGITFLKFFMTNDQRLYYDIHVL